MNTHNETLKKGFLSILTEEIYTLNQLTDQKDIDSFVGKLEMKYNEQLITLKNLVRQQKSNIERCREFNNPYNTVVAINCYEIGDDNDYSCFLNRCVINLYKSGHQHDALTLANTDPMLNLRLNITQLDDIVKRYDLAKEQAERLEQLYYSSSD